MVLVVLPLLVVTMVLVGASAYFAATTGITRVATDFLGFKVRELEKHVRSQWQILVDNGLTDRPEMVRATQLGIESYASSMLWSSTEAVLAVDREGQVAMSTQPIELSSSELAEVRSLRNADGVGLTTLALGGKERVTKGFEFEPYGWYFMVTELRSTFYQDVNQITYQTLYILVGGCVIAVTFLLLFSRRLTGPLVRMADTMRHIISSANLDERVLVEYDDETGQLAHTFNIMVGELQSAYTQIKKYAFQSAVAQKKEARIRNIFQKYVPQEMIERFYQNPESMLVGDNRELAVLFSDIRGFSTISENLMPDELVNSLNHYFSLMVEIIMEHKGIVDKYIGDAIMAFFGAPVHHDDDAYHSVLAALEMGDALAEFNRHQLESGRPSFRMGIGINYGLVTVGNIGSEKKMDYTVIGDMVNLASRLEGLTKYYKQELIVSDSVQSRIGDLLPSRLLDVVAVKGKTAGTRIYAVAKNLPDRVAEAWEIHNSAMEAYLSQEFDRARRKFDHVLELVPEDTAARTIASRCDRYSASPPGPEWDGVEVMTEK
jgi:class 3 adenylate cyclase/HAMP domain-containing protein